MIQSHLPKFVIIEEVPQFMKHGLPLLMEPCALGSLYDFSYGILNPRGLGLPVSRPRLYCVLTLRHVASQSVADR